jgi:hypothetical protein
MKNKKVIGKFNFEVLGIGGIGYNAPKSNSILVVDEKDNVKTKLTQKGLTIVVLTMIVQREARN